MGEWSWQTWLALVNLAITSVLIVIIVVQRERNRIMVNPAPLDLSALTAQVKENTDTEASAVQCIEGLAALLNSVRGNQAAIDSIVAQMKTGATNLSAAVVANTPAASSPPDVTPPATTTPVVTPPANNPPADNPPADNPPVTTPNPTTPTT